ncbi:hypothetical protein H4I96_08064 [Botrytis cinerea]
MHDALKQRTTRDKGITYAVLGYSILQGTATGGVYRYFVHLDVSILESFLRICEPMPACQRLKEYVRSMNYLDEEAAA